MQFMMEYLLGDTMQRMEFGICFSYRDDHHGEKIEGSVDMQEVKSTNDVKGNDL